MNELNMRKTWSCHPFSCILPQIFAQKEELSKKKYFNFKRTPWR